jgi:competence protein ComEC
LLSGLAAEAAVALGPLVLLGLGAATRRLGLAVAAGSLLLVGCAIGAARLDAIDRSELGPLLGHAVRARGYLVKRERPSWGEARARMRLTAVREGTSWRRLDDLVQVRADRRRHLLDLALGEEIEVAGGLEQPGSGDGSDFDYAEYLRRAGVHALLRADSIRRTGRRRGALQGFVDALRRRAEVGVGAGLDPALASLARGVVLGQDERIPARMTNDFKDSGLAHLLAVSGQNVTLLAILAIPLLAAVGLGRRGRLIVVLALIALYVPLTGAGASVLRAGAMGAAATAAALAGRPASRWYCLLLATAFTLLLDPRAWRDPGWQLSFAAVVGIFCLASDLKRRLGKAPPALAEGAALTISATIATAPLAAFHFQRVSLVSLAANLLALPAVAPIMWLGMLAAALAQVWVAPAAILNGLSGYCLGYLAAIARLSADVPHAVLSIRLDSGWKLALTYAVIATTLLGSGRAGRSRALRRRWAAVVTATVLVVCAGRALHERNAGPPGRFTVTFLDVGQGDATLLQAPGGTAVLIDGGPGGTDMPAKVRAVGARSLDLVVLTHPQADHEDGLEAVARELRVGALLDGGAGAQTPVHRRIVALARKHRVRVMDGRAGQTIRVGPIRLVVLSPEGGFAATRGGQVNDRALVLIASYAGLDVFLPADAESNITAALPLRPVEILKVAHHGSEDEGLSALLERLQPEVAVIEVGDDNRYGHPAVATLTTLEARVPDVYRTDRDGDVQVSLTARGPLVSHDPR